MARSSESKGLLRTLAKQMIILQCSLSEKPWTLLPDVRVQVNGLQGLRMIWPVWKRKGKNFQVQRLMPL
ncbi:hypothetical protein HS088_TW07G00083 [Tripterygium wilfordii]|uniref:Uncharacterized protein n=1 Tax=Tripterygium wilfordii TaxID=458696 RepID=A0A7J7DDX6_TRIWF|nr:hypothetical protein HS088_TW07G00083 [Tripterygium wilfordii]